MHCRSCGAQLQDDWIACPKCAQPIEQKPTISTSPPTEPSIPKKPASKLPVFFLGLALLAFFSFQEIIDKKSATPSETSQELFSSENVFIIRIEGTAGLPFKGSYTIVTTEGLTMTQPLNGKVPASYVVKADFVSATLQKQADDGILRIDLNKNGRNVRSAETIAPGGTATASAR